MPIDRDVLEAVREMDEHDLRRLLILARARLENRGFSFEAASGPNVSLREQWVRCGKEACSRCPHGPYWYAFWSEDGRRRSRYVGKLDEETVNPVENSPGPNRRDVQLLPSVRAPVVEVRFRGARPDDRAGEGAAALKPLWGRQR